MSVFASYKRGEGAFDIWKNTNFYGNYVGNAIYYNKCEN